jgi:alkanesulfonate monooxygenase SsuD/methylene tetrahydromethanopterin reductase-like flavin-dependent oxidoreductase (luciferase family)
VSPTEAAAARFGRRGAPSTTDLAAEAADTVEVVRRLWDSWEDDAVIRDRETGRYVDRDKLHYVDFTGPYFSVRGPSITPRSPQGQPIVAVERDGVLDGLAVAEADLVLVRGRSVDEVADGVSAVHAEARSHGRPAGSPAVLVEVRVGDAAGRVALDGVRPPGPGVGLDVVGDAAHVRAGLEELLGIADGVLLHPDALDTTLDWLAGDVVGPLVSGHRPSVATLRDRLGLARPANRYASAGAT